MFDAEELIWIALPAGLVLILCTIAAGLLLLQHLWDRQIRGEYSNRLSIRDTLTDIRRKTVGSWVCAREGHGKSRKVCTSIEDQADAFICFRCGAHFLVPWRDELAMRRTASTNPTTELKSKEKADVLA